MINKWKFVGWAFLVCTLLLNGCNAIKGSSAQIGGGKKPQGDEVEKTPAEEKKALLLKQIDRKFENPEAHFELGQLYHADGLWSQAENQYNTAMRFDPAHRRAQAAMVRLLIDGGDTNRAKLYADIYMNQVASSPTESLRLGQAFQKQNLDDYALSCYHQALHLAPNSAGVNKQIGYYYLSKNDKAKAQEYLTRSFQIDPRQPDVAGELGRLGVAVRIPQNTEKNTGKLDKIVEKPDKETKVNP
jgi:tetratricopeptide (TPR) repeat protein